jgi:hypothetical protein
MRSHQFVFSRLAIELDLVNPSLSARRLLDSGRQRGLDEAGKIRFGA